MAWQVKQRETASSALNSKTTSTSKLWLSPHTNTNGACLEVNFPVLVVGFISWLAVCTSFTSPWWRLTVLITNPPQKYWGKGSWITSLSSMMMDYYYYVISSHHKLKYKFFSVTLSCVPHQHLCTLFNRSCQVEVQTVVKMLPQRWLEIKIVTLGLLQSLMEH